jgi:hypothetical protein
MYWSLLALQLEAEEGPVLLLCEACRWHCQVYPQLSHCLQGKHILLCQHTNEVEQLQPHQKPFA